VPIGAFLGDPVLKAGLLSRVREGWEARRIVPLGYLKWSGDGRFASLAGTIGETQDPDIFIARTGLTVELALLCETLINAGITFEDDAAAPLGFVTHGDEAIWSFGTEWLSAIAVDRDVSDVVGRFLPVFLRQILSDDFALADDVAPAVRTVADEILNLWACEARGEAVPPKAWRTVRASALRASEGNYGPGGRAVADLVESLPWPSGGIAKEFPAICRKFLHSHQQALAARLLTNQDRIEWAASLAADRELAQLRSEPQYASMTDENLLDRFPEIRQAMLASKHPAAVARIEDAMRRARSQLVPFLRRQMDGLLDLLREKPD
jgi:hypothetical protein